MNAAIFALFGICCIFAGIGGFYAVFWGLNSAFAGWRQALRDLQTIAVCAASIAQSLEQANQRVRERDEQTAEH
jgi:hypothetical protein